MHIKDGFDLRDVCGEKLILARGIENINFSSLIRFNETSAYLWENLIGKEFSIEDMANLLIEEYEVEKETALNDATELIKKWIELNIIEK